MNTIIRGTNAVIRYTVPDVDFTQIGSMVNNFLANGEINPKEMRYILKAILGEVAEMELTQLHASQLQLAQKDKVEE